MNALALLLLTALDGGTVGTRFTPPDGAVREALPDGGFGEFLRALPLLPDGTPVRLFNGGLKRRQDVHAAVVDLDVGTKDLQQCADAAIRLWAEYRWARGRADDVCFRATSGDVLAFRDWSAGTRPTLVGSKLRFTRAASPDASRASFRRYLDVVFTYAGTQSLARGLRRISVGEVTAGDLFLQGGSPGHAVIVVDVARTVDGRRFVLLAQSYMPAQSIHVLRNPARDDAWYELGTGDSLQTPEWTFTWTAAVRFGAACP